MGRTTYAPSGIVIGILIGLGAWAQTKSVPIGVIVAIVLSVVFWFAIRALESLLEKGIDKGISAASNAIKQRKEGKADSEGAGNAALVAFQSRNTSSATRQVQSAVGKSYCTKCGNAVSANQRFCNKCGSPLNRSKSAEQPGNSQQAG